MKKRIITFFTDTKYGITDASIRLNGKKPSYGVVNEREVRVVAGLMFAVGLATLLTTMFTQNFIFAAVIVPLFLLEFVLKVVFGPQASVLAILVRPLISHMQPEWVGAIQKRFAWTLGAIFALVVLLLLFGIGLRGPFVLLLCSICLLLMWLESAAGICLGCEMYARLTKIGLLPAKKDGPSCSGGVCEV